MCSSYVSLFGVCLLYLFLFPVRPSPSRWPRWRGPWTLSEKEPMCSRADSSGPSALDERIGEKETRRWNRVRHRWLFLGSHFLVESGLESGRLMEVISVLLHRRASCWVSLSLGIRITQEQVRVLDVESWLLTAFLLLLVYLFRLGPPSQVSLKDL